ncbi:MAG TPA: hypothetical protein VMW27_11720 [Thermoanaerobaculia bacterium]|nr:hypothetical protein [Thermoanaerobaculia bacterium]
MSVANLNSHRSFHSLLDMSRSFDAEGDYQQAFSMLTQAMDRMYTDADQLSLDDGAALFLNLALVAGRMDRPELGMRLLERSREIFARMLGSDRVVGPSD